MNLETVNKILELEKTIEELIDFKNDAEARIEQLENEVTHFGEALNDQYSDLSDEMSQVQEDVYSDVISEVEGMIDNATEDIKEEVQDISSKVNQLEDDVSDMILTGGEVD